MVVALPNEVYFCGRRQANFANRFVIRDAESALQYLARRNFLCATGREATCKTSEMEKGF